MTEGSSQRRVVVARVGGPAALAVLLVGFTSTVGPYLRWRLLGIPITALWLILSASIGAGAAWAGIQLLRDHGGPSDRRAGWIGVLTGALALTVVGLHVALAVALQGMGV